MTAQLDLKRVFPGALYTEAPADERAAWAIRWGGFLWADTPGIVALASGRPRKEIHTDTGEIRYRHDDFGHRFYEWPRQADLFGRDVVQLAADGLDVYTAPSLRTSRARRKENGAGGRVAWADLDGPLTGERLAVIARLGDAARLVSSGTGSHLYVSLDTWLSPDDLEAANRALRDALDGDHKWSNESLLRPPGSWNLKPLVLSGRTPALVQGVTL